VAHGYDEVLPFLHPTARTIVDLGANIGLASRWLLSKAPGAALVAVEPEPGNVAVLRENLSQFPSARVIPACVGATPRRVRMVTDSGEWGFHMQDVDGAAAGAGLVDVLPMGSILEWVDGDVDLLKCDIEGAEVELFGSCEGWIRRVRLMVIECHNGYAAADLSAAIRRSGGDMECVWSHGTDHFGHETVVMRRRGEAPARRRPND